VCGVVLLFPVLVFIYYVKRLRKSSSIYPMSSLEVQTHTSPGLLEYDAALDPRNKIHVILDINQSIVPIAPSKVDVNNTSNNQHVVLQTATGATAKSGDKYLQARLLEYGPVQASTLGLVNFMGVDQASFFSRYSAGVDAMERVVKDRSQVDEQRADIENDRRELENLVADGNHDLAKTKKKEIDEKTKETDEHEKMQVKAEKVFLHILNEEAGSCNETFQEGWKMDCDPDTGEVLPERLVDDGKGGKRGMRAEDFWEHPNSVACGHTKEEVISGRFYTTFGFKPINIPLGDPKRKDKKGKIFKPRPCP
jgi:hypothetical protein